MAYEDIRGCLAEPLYKILNQAGEYTGEKLAEIRTSASRTSVTVHAQNSFTTLESSSDGSISLSVIANGKQTLEKLFPDGKIVTTETDWSPKIGLNGPSIEIPTKNPEAVANKLKSAESSVSNYLNSLKNAKNIEGLKHSCKDVFVPQLPPAAKGKDGLSV
jgi:hypothetical protein